MSDFRRKAMEMRN
jgi:ElaB/YqjD/DUF883 family membrane-anchored ribosome-binding protein